ncbi:MAG: AmmeMemoRadiSam system protein B [Synergistaceae bacterium]|nr:AmmeMemoRadiSam system protein B [Synergistaceae bacterium]
MRSCISSLFRTRAAALAAALLFFALPAWGETAGALSPHHGVAGALIDRLYAQIQAIVPHPRRVIVIGPDHFRRAKHNIVIGASDWGTRNVLRGDAEGAELSHLFRQDEVARRDHCVTEHIPRIAKFFPEASVLSIIVKPAATDLQVLRACQRLEALLREGDSVVILSMDLSHYKPREQSDAEDEKSLELIRDFQFSKLNNADIDCPRGARLFLMLMQRLGLTHATLLERSNSADFLGSKLRGKEPPETPVGPSDRTTGHATMLFTPTGTLPPKGEG